MVTQVDRMVRALKTIFAGEVHAQDVQRFQEELKMAAEIQVAATRARKQRRQTDEPEHLMTPGSIITTDTGFMRCS